MIIIHILGSTVVVIIVVAIIVIVIITMVVLHHVVLLSCWFVFGTIIISLGLGVWGFGV